MATEHEVFDLERRLGCAWPSLARAREQSALKRDELRQALAGLDSADLSIVAFGSLARGELTDSSDLDWTLLVDGSADPKHFEAAQEVADRIKRVIPILPGAEGVFGKMVFSHDLVHRIGGEDDTNRNTTRRSLMLLEAVALGRDEAFERTIRAILSRYLLEDRTFVERKTRYHVPRFMLNDFARYWRTMAVDFAYKHRKRQGQGAAIRNLKLRFSRKLLFASALLSSFSCHVQVARDVDPGPCPQTEAECIDCLRAFLRKTPLDILAAMVLHLLDRAATDEAAQTLAAAAKDALSSYDQFLGILADASRRKHLEQLSPEDIDDDPEFQRARAASHGFRDGLLRIFFDTELAELTRFYGVF